MNSSRKSRKTNENKAESLSKNQDATIKTPADANSLKQQTNSVLLNHNNNASFCESGGMNYDVIPNDSDVILYTKRNGTPENYEIHQRDILDELPLTIEELNLQDRRNNEGPNHFVEIIGQCTNQSNSDVNLEKPHSESHNVNPKTESPGNESTTISNYETTTPENTRSRDKPLEFNGDTKPLSGITETNAILHAEIEDVELVNHELEAKCGLKDETFARFAIKEPDAGNSCANLALSAVSTINTSNDGSIDHGTGKVETFQQSSNDVYYSTRGRVKKKDDEPLSEIETRLNERPNNLRLNPLNCVERQCDLQNALQDEISGSLVEMERQCYEDDLQNAPQKEISGSLVEMQRQCYNNVDGDLQNVFQNEISGRRQCFDAVNGDLQNTLENEISDNLVDTQRQCFDAVKSNLQNAFENEISDNVVDMQRQCYNDVDGDLRNAFQDEISESLVDMDGFDFAKCNGEFNHQKAALIIDDSAMLDHLNLNQKLDKQNEIFPSDLIIDDSATLDRLNLNQKPDKQNAIHASDLRLQNGVLTDLHAETPRNEQENFVGRFSPVEQKNGVLMDVTANGSDEIDGCNQFHERNQRIRMEESLLNQQVECCLFPDDFSVVTKTELHPSFTEGNASMDCTETLLNDEALSESNTQKCIKSHAIITKPVDNNTSSNADLINAKENGYSENENSEELHLNLLDSSRVNGNSEELHLNELDISRENDNSEEPHLTELDGSRANETSEELHLTVLDGSRANKNSEESFLAELNSRRANLIELDSSRANETSEELHLTELDGSRANENSEESFFGSRRENGNSEESNLTVLDSSRSNENREELNLTELESSSANENSEELHLTELESSRSNENREESNLTELESSRVNENSEELHLTELESSRKNENSEESKLIELESSRKNENSEESFLIELDSSRANENSEESKLLELDSSRANKNSQETNLTELESCRSKENSEELHLTEADRTNSCLNGENIDMTLYCNEDESLKSSFAKRKLNLTLNLKGYNTNYSSDTESNAEDYTRNEDCMEKYDYNKNEIQPMNHADEFSFNECVEEVEDFDIKPEEIKIITEHFHALNVLSPECYGEFEFESIEDLGGVENLIECKGNALNNNEQREMEALSPVETTPRIRRCSSLKTGKTPPGTPSRKKIVRFADVLGLDLADVRTFLDEIPKIPSSAYNDLTDDLDYPIYNQTAKNQRVLIGMFRQPGGQGNFLEKVTINQVMLENAVIEDPVSFSIRGLVRVRNIDFDKQIHVRYSIDSWKTFSDLQAIYVDNSSDGFTDKFTFLLYAYSLSIGQKIEFAVRYQSKTAQFWDNNSGANYCFQCLPASNPTASVNYAPISMGIDDQIATFYYMEATTAQIRKLQEEKLTNSAVHQYINKCLQKNNVQRHQINKGEFYAVLVVLFFSILFLYVKMH